MTAHVGYMGGLKQSYCDGYTMPYYATSSEEILFHVSTRMPSTGSDIEQKVCLCAWLTDKATLGSLITVQLSLTQYILINNSWLHTNKVFKLNLTPSHYWNVTDKWCKLICQLWYKQLSIDYVFVNISIVINLLNCLQILENIYTWDTLHC